MGNLFSNLLAMSIAGSIVVVLMLLLRPVTAKIFSAKWQYGIGKMAIVYFLLPVLLIVEKITSVLSQTITPSYSSGTPPMAIPEVSGVEGFVVAIDTLMEKHLLVTMEKHLSLEVMGAALFIWFAGAIAFAGWHFYCYRRFTKQLWADSFPLSDDAGAILLSSCKAALGIHGDVKLMLNPKIKSPMFVGLRRPMISLPISNMQELDLKLVLTHELMHLKRKDLWVKMLALLAGTVHWFNPVVHVLRKDVSTWGELACDEALASGMSHEERKHYGEAILNALDNHSSINTAFCSSLCKDKKHIERRLIRMLNVKKTKKYITVLAVAAILAIGGIGLVLAASSAGDDIDSVINVAVEKQEAKPVIEDTETRQAINVDVKSLDIGQFVAVGGPYTLEEGDIIRYDITAKGNGNLNADFRKTDKPNDGKGYFGEIGLSGNFMKNSDSFIVPKSLAGTYYLWIGNFDGKTLDSNNNSGALNSIKGTVEISVKYNILKAEYRTCRGPSREK
jgi:bla regulator protein BlaR1